MLLNYLAAAVRDLLRNRVHAAINLLGLSVGFAAALLIALYVHDQLSYDRFFPGYRDVFLLSEVENMVDHRLPAQPMDSSFPDLAANLRARLPQIAEVARVMSADDPPRIRHGRFEADEAGFLWVDPSFFRVIPLKSLAGDLNTALSTPNSVVLTRTAARKYFGRDRPLGEVLQVNSALGSGAASSEFNTYQPMRVTAIIEDLPADSYLKGEVFGSSLAAYSGFEQYDLTADQGPFRNNSNYTFLRLRHGASVQQLRRGLSALAAQNSDTSTVYPPGFTIGLRLTPIGDLHLASSAAYSMSPRGDSTLLAALAAIAVLIVASASFNFVALMTARAAERAIETGVRKTMGALRRQLVVQFLGEAVVYVAVAMVLAAALTEILLPAMNAALKQKIEFNFLGDPLQLVALLIASLGLGLMAGAYPAFVLSAYRPAEVLKGGPAQGATGGVVRRALVSLQFAIMIGLVITAATIWRQTLFSIDSKLRVRGSSMLLIDNACDPSGHAFRESLATLPGVAAAACASGAELYDGGMIVSARLQGGPAIPMVSGAVDYGALETYGLRPLAGRFFDHGHGEDGRLAEGDTAENPSVVINEMAARRLGFSTPSQAIGKIVTWNRRRWSPKPMPGTVGPSEIIGVSPDFGLDTRRPDLPQILYVDPSLVDVLSVRLIGSQIPEALSAIDASWSRTMHTGIHRHFLSQTLQDMYADVILQGTAISLGAALAAVIAALGLFGLSAHSVERRTKEIGIRKVMGASRADILRMLLWQFARPVLWANVLAWSVAGYLMHRWLQGFTSHVNLDPLVFLGAGAAALAIALVTVMSHALLVARTKPAMALRYE